jgi:apolipoprotein N-acyltransferase
MKTWGASLLNTMKLPRLSLGVSPREGLLATGAALLGAAAFPPLGLWPFALVSVACLLRLLRDRPLREALDLSLVYGVVYGLGTMYWFFGIFSGLAIPMIALMGAYFGLLGALVGMTRGRNAFLRAAMVGIFAVAVEWLRGDCWYLRFPWYTVPHALATAPVWIAAVRWVGVYGLSFIVWSIAAGGAFGRNYVWAAFLLLPAGFWFLGSVGEADKRALLFQTDGTDQLEALMKSAPQEDIDLAVTPEYAYMASPQYAIATRNGPGELAKRLHCPVVFGAVEGTYGEAHFQNVAVVIDGDAQLLDTFPKQRPVPMMADGDPGTRRPIFPVKDGVLGVGVCYDFDAPEVAADLVRQGATVLVVPTHDSWSWGGVRQHHHGLLVRLRAVENDRWVLRAVNTGRTEVIDPHGVSSPDGVRIGEKGFVVLPFAHRNTKAPGGQAYVFGPLAAGLTVLIVALFAARSWHNRKAQLTIPARLSEGAPALSTIP